MIYSSIYHLLRSHAAAAPDATAILAPNRSPLSYGCLFRLAKETARHLNRLGIGRNDRVALVLPNGPELAAALLTVAGAATCAPLNPEEVDFQQILSELEAKAIIILEGQLSAAREAAQASQVPIIELTPLTTQAAGLFTLTGQPQPLPNAVGPSQPDDVAFLLPRTEPMLRPTFLPLLHCNICTSARNIGHTLQLTAEDRCLNLMPLFQIHGLMLALLSSISAGASVECTSGFDAPHFYEWLAQGQQTWYTADPILHQVILSYAAANQISTMQNGLRLIHSSASLPPEAKRSLEEMLQAPVIESYDLTEATPKLAKNPLPPLARPPNLVSWTAGKEGAVT